MPNPFYQNAQNYGNITTSNVKNLYNAFLNASNPYQLFTNMVGKNPKMQPLLRMLNQGFSPQAIFNNLCEQRGINPQEFIKTITGKY